MLLWTSWALFLSIGLLALGVFLQDTLRSRHGTAWLPLDLATASADWQQASLQPWGRAPYRLRLSSRDPLRATVLHGPRWSGRIEIELVEPTGRTHRHWQLDGTALAHRLSGGHVSEDLGNVNLGGVPWRTWQLRARVTSTDPAFANVSSTLQLADASADQGMGAMLIYLLLLPAALGLLIALIAAAALAMQGTGWPLAVTAALTVLILLWLPIGP